MIPARLFDEVAEKCTEGLALALANDDDGAVIYLQWCNKAFTQITGYTLEEVRDKRGTLLVGPDTEQSNHLLIINKLMNWERFAVKLHNNRKNGETYLQQLNWIPMSDPTNGQRWWLISVVELAESQPASVEHQQGAATEMALEISANLMAKIERLQKENARLYALAKSVTKESNEDPLTGLSNRRHFEVELQSWIADLTSGGAGFAVLYIDLDRFKSVNDTLGHDAGDHLLVRVAGLLRKLTNPADLIARLGGDEFVILKRLGDSALNISGLADEIVQQMQQPFVFEGKTIICSTSVGVAIAHASMDNLQQVVTNADSALYHAKSKGKARWSFFTDDMHAEAVATKQLASDLLVACEERQFTPFFQPVINAATGMIASAEVLVRWPHPKRGLLPPDAFLETAANMGILERIDEIVFSHLRKTLRFFDDFGASLPRIAVNVSAGRLSDPSFIHDIKKSGIDPNRLIVEILESVYLERMNSAVRATLDELVGLGITVAIDDFGTGHASVQGLLQVRPAVLKIDRQFIQPIVTDETSRGLVASIIGIGKSLNMTIVAEGVETEEHARFVSDMGADFLQGFHFGKPMPAAELRKKVIDNAGLFWSAHPTPHQTPFSIPAF